MASTSPTAKPSRVVSGRYPPPGADPVADAIRKRRGDRGITPLDANLLHIPHIAGGYNYLLGAIRTKGILPGDIREAMILRIAALNRAAYEWIQHANIGRKEGLSTGQLYAIRDTETPLPADRTILTPLLAAAVLFTDHSTRGARIPIEVIEELKTELKKWFLGQNASVPEPELEAKVEDLYVEAAMVVASYNMVSRFLLSTDVAGVSDIDVPWPIERKEHSISLPSFPPEKEPTHKIHAITLTTSPSAPWLVFANSLLTDLTMWSYIIPFLLDLPSSSSTDGTTYNILLHSQRGHGLSTLPPPAKDQDRLTTIPFLAIDIANLIDALGISTPVRSIIGVSQGGAVAMAFANLYGEKAQSVVVCDTAAATPAGNKETWEDRIRLARGASAWPASGSGDNDEGDVVEYARKIGMGQLAQVTVPRWFPSGSICHPEPDKEINRRTLWVEEMIAATDLHGFAQGARALGSYNVIDLPSPSQEGKTNNLFESPVEKVLLLAGKLDGGGRVGNGLRALGEKWSQAVQERDSKAGPSVNFVEISSSGHLPMIDGPEAFCAAVAPFLSS